jgi:hypothetical protein
VIQPSLIFATNICRLPKSKWNEIRKAEGASPLIGWHVSKSLLDELYAVRSVNRREKSNCSF